MKRRIMLWGLVGFLVAVGWVIVSLAIPMSTQPVLENLGALTCPIALVGRTFQFGVKWYWVVVSNVFVYASVGLIFEALMPLAHPRRALP